MYYYWQAIVQYVMNHVLIIYDYCNQGRIQGGGGGGRTLPKIGINMIFWRKIVIFHTKYPTIIVPPSARRNVYKCAHLTWNPGSAPGNRKIQRIKQLFVLTLSVIIRYSGLCLIRYTKGPGKCVELYRMSEYSGFILVNINTLGPYIFVGCHRMSDNSGVGLHKFHCIWLYWS
jgi:hypothetical protein